MQYNIGQEEINELVKWRERKKKVTMWKEIKGGQGEERGVGSDYTLIVDSLLICRFLVWVSEQFISVLKHWSLQKAGAEDEGQGMKNIKPRQYQANITNSLSPPHWLFQIK